MQASWFVSGEASGQPHMKTKLEMSRNRAMFSLHKNGLAEISQLRVVWPGAVGRFLLPPMRRSRVFSFTCTLPGSFMPQNPCSAQASRCGCSSPFPTPRLSRRPSGRNWVYPPPRTCDSRTSSRSTKVLGPPKTDGYSGPRRRRGWSSTPPGARVFSTARKTIVSPQ